MLSRYSFYLLLGTLGGQSFSWRVRSSKLNTTIEPSTYSSRFLNAQSKAYIVQSLPVVSDYYDIGELYSGLIPVYNDLSRAFFYVFQPTAASTPVDEITIWLNGGPGCSSLEGFFQENGRFLWQPGSQRPIYNEFSWVNLTNMLWIEQPVGTGFSPGQLNVTNEEEVAVEMVSWFLNFQQIFQIKNFKIYIAGESYAGRYIPYISSAMLDKNNLTHFNLKGALLYDPIIGVDNNILQTTIAPFVLQNNNLFNLGPQLLEKLMVAHKSCGYGSYLDKYLAFPPNGPQPRNIPLNSSCNVAALAEDALLRSNPCANSYNIALLCPTLWDVLQGSEPYFNRLDVKRAMHAPANTKWIECDDRPLARDSSLLPILNALPRVIEKTNRVLISNGDFDNNVLTNATLLAIQNMTFNGHLGFQSRPSTPIDIQLRYSNRPFPFNEPQGLMGIQHFERGLMWAETYQSGHQGPQYQPRSAYRHIQWILGHIDEL